MTRYHGWGSNLKTFIYLANLKVPVGKTLINKPIQEPPFTFLLSFNSLSGDGGPTRKMVETPEAAEKSEWGRCLLPVGLGDVTSCSMRCRRSFITAAYDSQTTISVNREGEWIGPRWNILHRRESSEGKVIVRKTVLPLRVILTPFNVGCKSVDFSVDFLRKIPWTRQTPYEARCLPARLTPCHSLFPRPRFSSS